MKYKITKVTSYINLKLHRIRALRDIPAIGVKKGDPGGFIEKEENLSQDGDCWVSDDAWVSEYACVSGDAQIFGASHIFGDARVYGNAQVYGNARVCGNAMVFGNAKVFGDAEVLSGKWKKSPLYIQGTRDPLTTCSLSKISIGCETHTVSEWMKNYKKIGKENEYSDKEISEYYQYLKDAAKFLGYKRVGSAWRKS